jgi:hypothetical protein
MERDGLRDVLGDTASGQLLDEHETVLNLRPDGLPSPVESALAQYADSIAGMSSVLDTEADPYTRGFVAGLRAAILVVANVTRA